MKISVVTVTYNSGATVADSLRSVAQQSHPDIEHVVIDGGSSDATVRIVKALGGPGLRLLSEPDRGIYDAMNKGIAQATGDVIGFLNSDDVFHDPQALERVAAAFADPAVAIVYGDIVFVAKDDTSRVVRLWTSRPHVPGLCARGWMPPHPSLYVRREVYERFGGYDIAFPAAADFEMALRLLDGAGLRSAYLPFVQVSMRMGGQSTRSIRNIVSGSREVSRACRKHGLPGGVRFVVWRLLAKVPQLLRRPKAP
ncbi:MAG: glycosyltransferase family 2 protein [Burkholderiaceae bacterium]